MSTTILTAMQAPISKVSGAVFNVGSDEQNHMLGELAEVIQRFVPNSRIHSDETAGDMRSYHVSFARIRDVLGFRAHWTLDQGIRQVVDVLERGGVGDYRRPEYSNLLTLDRPLATELQICRITGWEYEAMSRRQLSPATEPLRDRVVVTASWPESLPAQAARHRTENIEAGPVEALPATTFGGARDQAAPAAMRSEVPRRDAAE
jgi:hypothetical protein